MAKWIVKKWGAKWVRHCPYCGHQKIFDMEPSRSWLCQCKAIVNESLYRKLDKLGKTLSKAI